jgi:hypothetical protein
MLAGRPSASAGYRAAISCDGTFRKRQAKPAMSAYRGRPDIRKKNLVLPNNDVLREVNQRDESFSNTEGALTDLQAKLERFETLAAECNLIGGGPE